jgi:ankyrin repeat protein
LEQKADIGAKTNLGWTPLHLAVSNGHIDIVRLLMDHNANVATVDSDGQTALHQAAFGGDEKIVKQLVGENGPRESIDGKGRTPLSLATSRGNIEVVKELGGNPQDIHETTPGGLFDADYSDKLLDYSNRHVFSQSYSLAS